MKIYMNTITSEKAAVDFVGASSYEFDNQFSEADCTVDHEQRSQRAMEPEELIGEKKLVEIVWRDQHLPQVNVKGQAPSEMPCISQILQAPETAVESRRRQRRRSGRGKSYSGSCGGFQCVVRTVEVTPLPNAPAAWIGTH